MKVMHMIEVSGGGRSAPATPIKLEFRPDEEEEGQVGGEAKGPASPARQGRNVFQFHFQNTRY